MAPFKALYGTPCWFPLCWTVVGDGKLLGLKMVQEISKKILVVRDIKVV